MVSTTPTMHGIMGTNPNFIIYDECSFFIIDYKIHKIITEFKPYKRLNNKKRPGYSPPVKLCPGDKSQDTFMHLTSMLYYRVEFIVLAILPNGLRYEAQTCILKPLSILRL